MAKLLSDRIAEVKARKDKLNAQLNQLAAKAKQEDRKRDTRRKIVIGGAILAAIEKEPALTLQLRKMLARFVTRDQDREVVADLIGEPPALQETAAR